MRFNEKPEQSALPVVNNGARTWSKVEVILGRTKDTYDEDADGKKTVGATHGVPEGSYRNLKLTSKIQTFSKLSNTVVVK